MKINKGQFRLSSRNKNFKFELHRGHGHLFDYIVNRLKWHLLPRINHVSKFPSHVDIELSSLCNLNCPMCYTTTEKFKKYFGIQGDDDTLRQKLFKKVRTKNTTPNTINYN